MPTPKLMLEFFMFSICENLGSYEAGGGISLDFLSI